MLPLPVLWAGSSRVATDPGAAGLCLRSQLAVLQGRGRGLHRPFARRPGDTSSGGDRGKGRVRSEGRSPGGRTRRERVEAGLRGPRRSGVTEAVLFLAVRRSSVAGPASCHILVSPSSRRGRAAVARRWTDALGSRRSWSRQRHRCPAPQGAAAADARRRRQARTRGERGGLGAAPARSESVASASGAETLGPVQGSPSRNSPSPSLAPPTPPPTPPTRIPRRPRRRRPQPRRDPSRPGLPWAPRRPGEGRTHWQAMGAGWERAQSGSRRRARATEGPARRQEQWRRRCSTLGAQGRRLGQQ